MNSVSDEPSINANGGSGWRGRQGIGAGAAAALTAGAGLATLVYVRRRRARARVRQLALLGLRAALIRVVLARATHGVAAFGGLGGGVLAALVLQNRIRRARARTRLEELTDRLSALEGQANASLLSDRPRPRDLVLGAVVGLVLAALMRRVTSGGKSQSPADVS